MTYKIQIMTDTETINMTAKNKDEIISKLCNHIWDVIGDMVNIDGVSI